jgi:hypothetical protein
VKRELSRRGERIRMGRTTDKMIKVVEDRKAKYEKMLQETESETDRHEYGMVIKTLTEVLKDLDDIVGSLPYT